jgi:lipopolysaccharide transport system permease protein
MNTFSGQVHEAMIENTVYDDADTVLIEPGHAVKHYWADVFHYRDLFFRLATRDISVRYKQTSLGVLWALLRPILTVLVFTFVFGRVANLATPGIPYALVVFSGMMPWFFFSSSVGDSSSSLISNGNLLTKVYFPRILIPASSTLVAAVDFLISFSLLILVMAYYGYYPSWRMLALPWFMLIAFVASLGIGLLFSALNVRYRDFQFIVPFALQFGLYISPVGFLSAVVPEKWSLVYALNPMVGVIDGFRWIVLGNAVPLRWESQLLSVTVSLLVFYSGIAFFRRFERNFADLI